MAPGPHPALVRWLRSETSLPIAVLHLVASFTDADTLLRHLDESAPGFGAGVESERLESLRAFVETHRDGIALVRWMGALHARAESELPSHGIGALRGLYDELAELDPGTAVALYAFGDARILAEATQEVVAYLKERGLVTPSCRLLDLGCGIGRLLEACAPLSRSVTGVDVSSRMIALATERVAALPHATARLIGGRELRDFPDASFELVLAADSWPHVLSLGVDASRALAREVARVLVPDGEFLLLNYSYRDDPTADARDVAALAAACGFMAVEAPARPFALWDATAFRLRRSAGIP